MSVNEDIRRRRQARILTIMRGQVNGKSDHHAHTSNDDGSSIQINEHEHRMRHDPEYAWKLKQQQWEAPDHFDRRNMDKMSSMPLLRYFRYQLGAGVVVFCLIWGMFQLDYEWAHRGQSYVERSLTEDFAFDTVAKWYNNFFQGTPSFLPTFNKDNTAEKVNALE